MTNAIYPSLKDKVVFISGGASGIGKSIVRHFAEQGCKVGFVDIADDAAKALIADIGPKARLHYEHCDVTDIAALQRAIEAVRKALGPITMLVNNAAHDQRHTIDEVTPEFWDNRVAVNLKHQFFAAQAIYPDMKAAGGGAIINYSSSAWMTATANLRDLFDREGRRSRPDQITGARPWRPQHPRQCHHSGLDHDAAPDRPLADAGG